jgi:hypothetical protein
MQPSWKSGTLWVTSRKVVDNVPCHPVGVSLLWRAPQRERFLRNDIFEILVSRHAAAGVDDFLQARLI